MIKQINLADFRNYASYTLNFESSEVIFVGPNGSGKSNLLEALSYLSILRSFRGASVREMVRIGCRGFTLSAQIDLPKYSEKLLIKEAVSGRRNLFIGESAIHKSSEFIGEFRTIPFVPEDRNIVSGSSGYRRRFFDMMISTLDFRYLAALSAYNRALIQRNRALKTANNALIKAFETELAIQAPVIADYRTKYSVKLSSELVRLFGSKYKFNLKYNFDYPLNKEEYLQRLESVREREKQRGCSLIGPQLDEFEFYLDEKLLRYFGSSGQIRISALMLRLAEFNIMRNLGNTPVVVLVDDVCGELDDDNRKLFFDTISCADQKFFTFTAAPSDKYFASAQIIERK